MKPSDFISLAVVILFCAVMFMGVQDHKRIVNDRIQADLDKEALENRQALDKQALENRQALEKQALENRQAAIRKQEIEEAYLEALKYKDNVTHDGNPSTKTYPIRLEATDEIGRAHV